jgi:hypothetical protein
VSGRVAFLRLEQFENASEPIDFIELGKLMEVRFAQLVNV